MDLAAVFAFIQQQWGDADSQAIHYSAHFWKSICDRAFEEHINRCHKPKLNPFCIRLVGQSGAGKTSQLLPAVRPVFDALGGCVPFAVRDFAVYHPNLDEIRVRYGEGLVREKTNAFGLMLLTLVLERCIQCSLPILLEMTLLAPVYERLVHTWLEQHHYHCDYQCLAIRREDSDAWSAERCHKTQRIVSRSSSDFFFQTLEPTLNELRSCSIENRVFIWDRSHTVPQVTTLADPRLWQKILDARQCQPPFLDFEAALKCKQQFLHDFYVGREIPA